MCCLGELCDYGNCTNIDTADIADSAWILDLEDIEKIPVLFYKKYAKANAMQEAQSIVSIKVRCCTANFVLI